MKKNRQLSDAFLLSRLQKFSTKVASKSLPKRDLEIYIGAYSMDNLRRWLNLYSRQGYFKIEVSLSSEYFKMQQDHCDIQLRADVLKHCDPFGALQRDPYGLTVKADMPLSETQIIEVIDKLPQDLAQQYLEFKFSKINVDKINEYLVANPIAAHHPTIFKGHKLFSHDGMVATDVGFTYNGDPFSLNPQYERVLLVLLRNYNNWCYLDDFTAPEDSIFRDKTHKDIDSSIRKTISATHLQLIDVVGYECIFNNPSLGSWKLKLKGIPKS